MATKQTDKFEVQGLKELQKQLKTFDQDILKKTTRKSVKAAMAPVESRAKTAVAKDSGAMHDSIKLSAGSTDQGQKNRVAWAAVKAGGRGAKNQDGKAPGEYVLELHYGTSRGKEENPFLLSAFEPYAQSIAAHFERELRAETEKGVDAMARRHKQNKK